MSRHEIEIEGLGPEWEPVKLVVRLPATAVDGSYECVSSQELFIRRKVRKYDWSKTLDDVLVGGPKVFVRSPDSSASFSKEIAKIWQPNIHGKCPVDGEACIVRVEFADGVRTAGLAGCYNWMKWVKERAGSTIIAWQFIRLVDGYEW